MQVRLCPQIPQRRARRGPKLVHCPVVILPMLPHLRSLVKHYLLPPRQSRIAPFVRSGHGQKTDLAPCVRSADRSLRPLNSDTPKTPL